MEKLKKNYDDDVRVRFVYDTVREIKAGRTDYVYSKESLYLLEKALKEKNVKYTVKTEEDYWVVKGVV